MGQLAVQAGNRTAFFLIGAFMAIWTILYGAIQATAPRILQARRRSDKDLVRTARVAAWALATIPASLALAAAVAAPHSAG